MLNRRAFPPAWIPHVVLALFLGGLALACGAGAAGLIMELVRRSQGTGARLLIAGLAALLAACAALCLLGLCRRVAILVRRPRLELSPEGILVCCYQPGWRAVLRPVYRWLERMIPWADFRGCRTDRVSVYEVIPVEQKLTLETRGDPVEITWGMFRPGVAALEREILDYWQLQIAKPAAEDARIPEFLQRLYARPVVFAGPRLGRAEIAGSILAVPVAGAVFCLHLRDLGFATALALYGVLAVVALVAGALWLRQWIGSTRFIRLGADGIAIGPEERRARLIPWPELALARVHTPAGRPPSSLTKLELRLRSGESVFVRAFPEAARWALLIDPPAGAVREARRLMAAGEDVLTAAREAGLPLPE